jgi:Ca2+-binding EF-hand superfamily protein
MAKPATAENTFEYELHEAFNVFDKDGDGFVDAHELMVVLAQIGEPATEDEIATMISEADLNGDGKMDYDEFVVGSCYLRNLTEKMQFPFSVFQQFA